MNSDRNYSAVLDIIELFQRFLDKAEYYDYLPGYLRMVINTIRGREYWSIIKHPIIDILKPYRMFLGKISGIHNKKIWVMDQENTLEELIEDTFSVKLNKSLESILMKNWKKRKKLLSAIESYPELYRVIKKRLDTMKEISKKYHLEISNMIDKETGNVWIEVKKDISNLDIKDIIIIIIFISIDALREIYKQLFECDDDEQKYRNSGKTSLINQLKIHVSAIQDIVLHFKDKLWWDHVGFSEWERSYITLMIKVKEETKINIYIFRELSKERPNKYTVVIDIKAPNYLIQTIHNKIKLTKRKENQLYYRKEELSLVHTIEEIKNIIQVATDRIAFKP